MSTNDNLVSIITPAYDSAKCIAATIDSVLAQTHENWEMLIVDDCSTDNTVDIVKSYTDERIHLYQNAVNSGAAVARNRAMTEAKGRWMAFLDSDDLWMPDKLEKQLAFMEDNGHAFSCTSYEHITEGGQKTGKVVKSVEKANYNRILLDCPVGNSTVIYDVDRLGKFEVPDIRNRDDDALWLKMLKKTPYIYGMDAVMMQYRIRKDSLSCNKSNKAALIKYHWMLYRNIEGLSLFRSCFHVCWWVFIKVLGIK